MVPKFWGKVGFEYLPTQSQSVYFLLELSVRFRGAPESQSVGTLRFGLRLETGTLIRNVPGHSWEKVFVPPLTSEKKCPPLGHNALENRCWCHGPLQIKCMTSWATCGASLTSWSTLRVVLDSYDVSDVPKVAHDVSNHFLVIVTMWQRQTKF